MKFPVECQSETGLRGGFRGGLWWGSWAFWVSLFLYDESVRETREKKETSERER